MTKPLKTLSIIHPMINRCKTWYPLSVSSKTPLMLKIRRPTATTHKAIHT